MSSTQEVKVGDIVDIQDLTNDERKMYLTEKINKYKLTFSVCVLYGFIAFILFLIAVFTSWGNVLFNDLAPFTFTYIIGTIIIIIFLANEIYNFKPRKPDAKLGYDAEMCPDYWKLEYVNNPNPTDSSGRSFLKDVNKLHFQYKCTLDDNVFNKRKMIELDQSKKEFKNNLTFGDKNRLYIPLDNDEKFGKGAPKEQIDEFKKIAANMNGYEYNPTNKTLMARSDNENVLKPLSGSFTAENIPLSCDTVYPMYLSVMDNENSNKNTSEPKNRYRCAYARACGVPWTEAGCV